MGLFNDAFPKASPPKMILVSAPLSKPKFITINSPTNKPKYITTQKITFDIPVSKPKNLILKNISQSSKTLGDWGIQVGTYSKKVNAHQIAIKTRRLAPNLLKMLPAELTPIYINDNIAWRVRFNNLDQNSARKICSTLLSKNISCIPIPSEQILGYLIKK